MLIIRLARRGRKGRAFFDLVVAEKSRPVQKKFVEKLGYLNPLTDGGKGELVFDKEKVEKYINSGAQCSQAVARLLAKNGCELAGKFIAARVTKPKKEAPKEEKEVTPEAEKPAPENTEEITADTTEKKSEEKPEEPQETSEK